MQGDQQPFEADTLGERHFVHCFPLICQMRRVNAILVRLRDAWLTVQNPELELQYKSCYARILDAKRRFLEAATRYYDLSQSSSGAADAPKVSRLSSLKHGRRYHTHGLRIQKLACR